MLLQHNVHEQLLNNRDKNTNMNCCGNEVSCTTNLMQCGFILTAAKIANII